MWKDLRIVSVQQFIDGKASDDLSDCVGSTHFDAGTTLPDGSVTYNYENLWLRYELSIPRPCRGVRLEAAYRTAHNSVAIVSGQVFGWGFGSETAPGEETPFVWDTENKTSGLLSSDERLSAGTAWLWLTYDFAGQNNCYVDNVSLPLLQGDMTGPGRIYTDGAAGAAVPHIAAGGSFKPASAYVFTGGRWTPTG